MHTYIHTTVSLQIKNKLSSFPTAILQMFRMNTTPLFAEG